MNRIEDRKSSIYVYKYKNLHSQNINLGNARNPRHLSLLKNGFRVEKLNRCTLKRINESAILSNTCAFDSISSVVMVSFCDSQNYSNRLLECKTKFVDFISKLVSNDITLNIHILKKYS